MKFKLTPEIMDQVIFGMENQNKNFYLNIKSLIVEELDTNNPSEEEYIGIPQWLPSDGFQLMEKFVSNLRNPVIREQLRSALSSGRGVFRNFKNALKEKDEIQRLWFNFKEKEMKNKVVEWYNLLCDAWGCEKVGPIPEETDELILSDFIFSDGLEKYSSVLLDYDFKAFSENLKIYNSDFINFYYNQRKNTYSESKDSWILKCAETPAGELAGFVWGTDEVPGEGEQIGISKIIQIFVLEEYRGLGIAKALLDKYVGDAYEREMKQVVFSLWGNSGFFENKIAEYGFSPFVRSFEFDLNKYKQL